MSLAGLPAEEEIKHEASLKGGKYNITHEGRKAVAGYGMAFNS